MASIAAAPHMSPQSFPQFPNLPLEIRCQIWSFVAEQRPRVLQLTYNPEEKTWGACKDGCGGLPTIVHVCREARIEALRPYISAFDTFINFDIDTIFVSDPIFAIRRPREDFFTFAHVKKIKNFALYSDIYRGLGDSHDHFPRYCDNPPAVLRKLEGLELFTLVISPDEDGLDMESEGDYSGFEFDGDESLDLSDDEVDDETETAQERPTNTSASPTAAEERIGLIDKRLLDDLDSEAMASMSKGYFREMGNIHFEAAKNNVDAWDNWGYYLDNVITACWEEKQIFEWFRPRINVMVVKYGLAPVGDLIEIYHDMGDHHEGVITYEAALKMLNVTPETPAREVEMSMLDGMSTRDGLINVDDLWKVIHALRVISQRQKSFRLQQTAALLVARLP